MVKNIVKLGCLGVILLTIAVSQGCQEFMTTDLLGALGAIASGQPEQLTKIALQRLEREAGYAALRVVLRNANVGGADYFVQSLKAFIEDRNGGEAVGAFLKGLDVSGVKEASGIINIFYAAAVTIRLTSTDVSKEVQEYIDYITNELHSYRDVVEMEAKGPPVECSSPEKTWETFITGLREGNWQPVARALVGYVPEGTDLKLVDKSEGVQDLKKVISEKKEIVAGIKYKIGRVRDMKVGLKALEINATTPKGKDTFWAVFEEHKNAWGLTAIVKDISLIEGAK